MYLEGTFLYSVSQTNFANTVGIYCKSHQRRERKKTKEFALRNHQAK